MLAWSTRRRGHVPALVLAVLAGTAPSASGQVPSPIPSNQESQILNLLQRVTALEEKLAALNTGTVKAPFKVVDAGGSPILQVLDARAGGEHSGVVILDETSSGTGGLVVYNKTGQTAVLLATNGEAGALGLSDGQGKVRTSLTGLGRIEVSDENENSFLTIAEDVSKVESEIRIGGDEGGFAIEMGSGNGAAFFGVDEDGVPALSMTDGDNRERAAISGEGVLQISNAAGKDILTVMDDITGEKAMVAIGGKDGGYLRVSDAAGKPAAGLVGSSRAVVVANAAGKTAAEMTVKTAGSGLFQVWDGGAKPIAVLSKADGGKGGILQISNGEVPVSSIYASEGGSGRWQLNDNSGNPVIEAGALTSGKGFVGAGPKYNCAPGLGGPMLPSPIPSCIVGIIK
jgi:hypothetical protein